MYLHSGKVSIRLAFSDLSTPESILDKAKIITKMYDIKYDKYCIYVQYICMLYKKII